MAGTMNKGSLIKGAGGSGGGGSASFPTIVTDSGSSLPSASGYQEGDTFLNTSDKKLYTTQVGGYKLASGINNTATFNSTNGSVTNFGGASNNIIYAPSRTLLWKDNVDLKIHFKINQEINNSSIYVLFNAVNSLSGSPSMSKYTVVSITNGKLHLKLFTVQYSTAVEQDIDICDTVLEIGTEYYLELVKEGTVLNITLSTEGYGINVIETKATTTSDFYNSGTLQYQKTSYGGRVNSAGTSFFEFFTIGTIYLADSWGNWAVVDTTSLLWDNGTSLTDKTEYADKTNGILYLNNDSDLIAIGGTSV